MGGDYYDGRDVVSTTSSTGFSAQSAQAVGKTSAMHSSLDPQRWKEENLQCNAQMQTLVPLGHFSLLQVRVIYVYVIPQYLEIRH